MRCLGIVIRKNSVYYSVVDGEKMDSAQIIDCGKQCYRSESSSLMTDFYNMFLEILTKYRPDKVVFELHLDANLQQIHYMHYPLGILKYVCSIKNIAVEERSNKWITAGKKSKIERFVNYFSSNKYLKDEMYASLIAWYGSEH